MRSLVQEPRVVAGIALMLIATLLGGVLLQHSTRRTAVWQFTHALARGTLLSASDVRVTEVALDAALPAYAVAGRTVVGRRLAHDVVAGELVADSALARGASTLAEVSVPVERLHSVDGLRRGQRVDVWWSSVPRDGEPVRSTRVLSRVRVSAVTESEVGGQGAVVLAVMPSSVDPLVHALRSGVLDLVRVDGGS